ncbi:MAG: hypothetical protein WD316_03885 [Phycisphaeraceae bacterium]
MTLIIAGLLIVVGVAGYTVPEATHWTALIPAFVGALLGVCGLVALAGAAARKHAIHAAMVIALLGTLAAFEPVTRALRGGEVGVPTLTATGAMALLLIIYLVLGVRSFIRARRVREAAERG